MSTKHRFIRVAALVLLVVSRPQGRERCRVVVYGPRREVGLERSKQPRSSPPALEKRLIDELARVFWDPDDAATFLWHAGFPSRSIPAFKNPHVFWTRAVREIANGALAGGLAVLVEAASARYPSNRVFERCASSLHTVRIRHVEVLRHGAPPENGADDDRLQIGWWTMRCRSWAMAAGRALHLISA